MATRAMAMEFSRIDPTFAVCAVAPGTVDTAMQEKIRSCTAHQFERVDKFLKLKDSGELHSPERVAAALIRLLMDGRFKNGRRYDLREMGG
jgi:benzil reductase ((S)-benzoin forming)